jgi:histidinol-phosphate phosphatase family protein
MKLVILDRDGVINFDSDQFIKNPREWNPIPGSMEAIAQLNQAGYRVVVATNQSGVGRGLFDMSTLNAIHAKMHKLAVLAGARIDAVFLCPHAPIRVVLVASQKQGCSMILPNVSMLNCVVSMPLAMRCAMCRLRSAPAPARFW